MVQILLVFFVSVILYPFVTILLFRLKKTLIIRWLKLITEEITSLVLVCTFLGISTTFDTLDVLLLSLFFLLLTILIGRIHSHSKRKNWVKFLITACLGLLYLFLVIIFTLDRFFAKSKITNKNWISHGIILKIKDVDTQFSIMSCNYKVEVYKTFPIIPIIEWKVKESITYRRCSSELMVRYLPIEKVVVIEGKKKSYYFEFTDTLKIE